ncbi:hypothetical protein WICPIJ_001618 [Wickerhamomyces pijperi]|uniref:DNA-directed RNA polymerase subunit n=1 Tax=Wickerhamomyces pijperi TaxID=599730 RepID=A0A9P8QCZ0_WICPI|nr:hypothetical protein WICPIJ_001618 [Wickerhamomyces pijperi]
MSTVTNKRSGDFQARSFKKRKQAPPSTNPVNSDGLSECFHKVRTSLYVSLAPVYLSNPLEGIKAQHLDPLLMKHFAKLNGVVISYTDLQLSNSSAESDDEQLMAKVNAHSPFCFLWVSAEFLIWKPLIGDNIEGNIYIQSPSHIGLLINDTFNASIKRSQIPPNWTFKANEADAGDEEDSKNLGQWFDENDMPIEGKLQILVKGIHTSGRVVSVEGSLITPGMEVESQPVVPAKTNKKIKFDDDAAVGTAAATSASSSLPVVDFSSAKDTDDAPTYEVDSEDEQQEVSSGAKEGEVVAEEDSSEDDADDSD